MYKYVHHIICNNKLLETAQVSNNREVIKEKEVKYVVFSKQNIIEEY